MKVSEIFYSLQGEGARAGEASVFVRLSGCDLACSFCDTEFVSGVEMSNEQILDRIAKFGCTWIVWTGGEPMLQLTKEIVDWFHGKGYRQAIESNGGHKIPWEIDWRVVSPKVAEHVLAKNFPEGVDELRYVRHAGQPDVPQPSIAAKHHFLSPMFRGNQPDKENLKHCIELCLKNPQWKLSLQLHKLLSIL